MKVLEGISTRLYRTINTRFLVISVVVFTIFIVIVLPRVAEQSLNITGVTDSPDTSFFYSAQDLYKLAETYGVEGRSYYIRSRYTFDIIWPMVYLLFLVTSTTSVFRFLKTTNPWRMVNLLPFVGVMFDFLENFATSMVMYRYPSPSPFVAALAPFFTVVKWLSISLSFIVLLGGLCFWVFRLGFQWIKKTDSL